jgi:protocatechuate 3,4-dioxygenase alpha subunit
MSGRLLPPTPGQTVGPFFAFGLEYADGPLLVPADHPGAVRLRGRLLDGAGDPVLDGLVELWQADPSGLAPRVPGSIRRDPSVFTGFGRCGTDPEGRWGFTTLVPGATDPGGAAFFALTVFARGLLHRLHTRAYLPDQPALETDPLLSGLAPERRDTLVARREDGDLVLDLRLQGEGESVFLRHPGHGD